MTQYHYDVASKGAEDYRVEVRQLPGNTRNGKALISFVDYCLANPDHRFWQALRNWSWFGLIFGMSEDNEFVDTFNYEGLDGKRGE